MPNGFIITKWTEDKGLTVILNYPETIKVDLDDMMRIFYAHITGAGEAGNVLVRLEKAQSNVASYFTGMESGLPVMINLMLELGEDPEIFGEAVIREINQNILKFVNQMGNDVSQTFDAVNNLKSYLKNALYLLDRLKGLTKEQRLAQIFSSKKGFTILNILQERSRSRKELQTILEEKLSTTISNLEFILDPFIKTGLLKQDWVEGINDLYLFLISDFSILRTPVKKLVENAKKNSPSMELAQKYLQEVKKFFSEYKPTIQDSLKIAMHVVIPDKYDFITLLRERTYPLNKLPKSSGDSFLNTEALLKSMEKDQIIKIITDSAGIEWIFLLTDISIHIFYPEYLIEKIRKDQLERKLKKEIAIKHLELLESSYKK